MDGSRRNFIFGTTAAGLGLGAVTLLGAGGEKAGEAKKGGTKKGDAKKGGGEHDEEVSAPEDLMREHGVLNRILLIYEEGLRRLRASQPVSHEAFHRPAQLVRRFVEDYHERLEERFIFPAFEQRQRLTDLVATLRRQHEAGRAVTDVVLRVAVANQFGQAERRQELVRAVEAFIRMYRPHEAREDTVLFPALPTVLTRAQIHELGERFEQEEDRLFGEGGFQTIVGQVADIERDLGIYDLDQFTPRPTGS
jgi:hemerythrin-like domain-containing protein